MTFPSSFSRTMVQLGLCGFRHSEIKEAHNALLDIQMGGRSKELLAQGLLPQVCMVDEEKRPIGSELFILLGSDFRYDDYALQ